MPILEKRNPHATRESVIKWSIGGAFTGMGLILFQWWVGRLPVSIMWLMIPSMILSAFVAGLAEWQWPLDDPDEECDVTDEHK